MYIEGLRLLQDLCSSSGELPSSIWLEQVVFDRDDLIGKGGEVHVYAGSFDGQKIVVRDVIRPRKFWTSLAGRDLMKVGMLVCHAEILRFAKFVCKRGQLIRREAITHSLLEHQNIIPFLGVCRPGIDKPPMIVLPYIENGSLDDFILNNPITGIHLTEIVCVVPQTTGNRVQ